MSAQRRPLYPQRVAADAIMPATDAAAADRGDGRSMSSGLSSSYIETALPSTSRRTRTGLSFSILRTSGRRRGRGGESPS